MSQRYGRRTAGAGKVLLGLLFIVFFLLGACCLLIAVLGAILPEESKVSEIKLPSGTLKIAYSPEKEELFRELTKGFNARKEKSTDGQPITIEAILMDPEAMVSAALNGELDALTPDSSLWLDQLDRAWQEKAGSELPLVGETVRYAVSPVVIAMWEDVARALGYPEKSLGWEDIITKAKSDPDFRWSHPSTASASGILATLAEFYAGAGKSRGLTIEDVQRDATLQYVAAIEKTVRYYGEGEWAVIKRALEEGRAYLDAFVVQEQLVIYFNRRSLGLKPQERDKLVAIYPREGTLWEDHPLALLERPELSPEKRLAFRRFQSYLRSEEIQRLILSYGYRPADLSISLDGPDSPITRENGANPSEPQTTLQIPNLAVVDVVRDVWWYTKRHTNVYLVADISGSMEGEKLAEAQNALRIFLGQIKGDMERVGLITFSTDVYDTVPLDELKRNRQVLEKEVDSLRVRESTALLDAVDLAYNRLQALRDSERINAIVVMTDGLENASRISLMELSFKIQFGNKKGVPVVIFCLGYGDDADYNTLRAIAEASGGQVRRGDLETIGQLYKIMSTYF